MNKSITLHDLGLCDYNKTWEIQEKYFDEIVSKKRTSKGKSFSTDNHLIFVEHPHVYTLGKSGDEHNLLVDYMQLQAKDAQFVKTNRGGDITYHGPGQLVGYPIFDLENFDVSLRKYIYKLEEVVIRTIKEYGIHGERDEEATGVWVDSKGSNPRKICAIGVRSSRFVTMHGFALNVTTDLSYFQHINPCGFQDKGVTSIEKELGEKVGLEEVKKLIEKYFSILFQ